MGDRVIFIFHSTQGDSDISPAVYGHWCGSEASKLLRDAISAGQFRKGDIGYTAARFVGFLCGKHKGNTGVGLFNGPANLKPETLAALSHGDAGVITVDVDTGKVGCFGGYTKPFEIENFNEALA